MRRRAIAGALAVLGVAAAPAAAGAATLTGNGGGFDYRAASGEVNNVRVFVENGRVTITDTALLNASGTCRLVTFRKARCGTAIRNGIMRLGDRDDSTLVQVPTPDFVRVLGGDGDDTFHAGAVRGGASRVTYAGDPGVDTVDYLAADRAVRISLQDRVADGRPGDEDFVFNVENAKGSNFGDTIAGDAAGNVVEGRGGGDVIRTGAGRDTIVEGASANGGDFISGGSNLAGQDDTVTYRDRRNPVSVTFENRTDLANDGEAGEGDNVMDDVEVVVGGRAGDRLTGNGSTNLLFGGPGGDRIAGLGGNDFLQGDSGRDTIGGNSGNDFVVLADREADFADCGSGTDTAGVDGGGLDFATACESVTRANVGTLALSPRTLTARPGRTAVWRLAWTHPARWTLLDDVALVLEHRGRRVGRVRLDQETRRLRASGPAIRLIAGRSAVRAAGPRARKVSLRLALRVARRYAGRTLTARVAATDDGGNRQSLRHAGRVRVRRR